MKGLHRQLEQVDQRQTQRQSDQDSRGCRGAWVHLELSRQGGKDRSGCRSSRHCCQIPLQVTDAVAMDQRHAALGALQEWLRWKDQTWW